MIRTERLMLRFSLLVLLQACATPVTEQPRVGFISDYSRLERTGDGAWLYTSTRVGEFSKFRIDGPDILFTEDSEFSEQFRAGELDELSTYFRERLARTLSEDDGYEIVEQTGPGVATIRIGLTAVDASIGALNVSLATKATGAGLGGAAMEGEMIDSVTGEQIAAAVQWGSGDRVLRAGLTRLGDAKLQINRWTRRLRERVDEAHGLRE